MPTSWILLLTVVAAPSSPASVAPQEAPASPSQSAEAPRAPTTALRVFIDCQFHCDTEYLRQEMTHVNWVRDRRDAQVHVLATRRGSAAGEEITLEFIGRESFEGLDDTYSYVNSDTDTDDEERRRLALVLSQGLVRYLMRTPLRDSVQVGVERPEQEPGGPGQAQVAAATAADDAWNFWVLRARVGGSVSDEQRRDARSVDGSLTANRTTDDWKIDIGVSGRYSESDFEFDDGSTFKDVSRRFGIGTQVIKTLGDHWGAGVGGVLDSSTFHNLDLGIRGAAALQYNFFPYPESSRRELTLTYFAGLTRFRWDEETIFGKTEETRGDQGVIASLDVNRPWGETGIDVEFASFLDDFQQNRLEVRANIEYRIVRGLSLDIFGSWSRVRDQIFLSAAGISDEEILLERRALETDSRFSLRVSLSYTFGSIFNNVVNARFSGNTGGFHRIFSGSGGDRRRR